MANAEHQSARTRVAALLVDRELSTHGVAGVTHVYERTFAQLAPILGRRGVHAIFARSAELVRAEAPLLSSFDAGDDLDTVVSSLASCLRDAPIEAARRDATVLFSRFFGLMVTFVGAELTTQIVRAAWPDVEVDLKEES